MATYRCSLGLANQLNALDGLVCYVIRSLGSPSSMDIDRDREYPFIRVCLCSAYMQFMTDTSTTTMCSEYRTV